MRKKWNLLCFLVNFFKLKKYSNLINWINKVKKDDDNIIKSNNNIRKSEFKISETNIWNIFSISA
jgi:hypothetical protein